MLRYCGNCNEEYDFNIKSVKDMDNLVCPVCGMKVDRNSKAPQRSDPDRTSDSIGNAVSGILYIAYIFYFACSIIGLAAYIAGEDKLLYSVTALCLILFFLGLLAGRLRFITGFIILPAAAAAGYAALEGLRGACAAVMIVFFVRFIIKDLLYTLFWKLIGKIG